MIALSNVTKQYGGQILFVDASFQVNPGEKIGLVGPNGAGKTTIFRLIMGEENPDEGTVEKPRRLSIGYFNQDISGLRGRSVLSETVAGAGEVALLGEEMKTLEEQMAAGGDDLDALVSRYGEVQSRFQELGGYDVEARFSEEAAAAEATIRADVDEGHALVNGKWLVEVFAPRRLFVHAGRRRF